MALLLNCGAVFLHIPTTGGTWVTEVLQEQGLVRLRISHKHADLRRVSRYARLYPWQYFKRVLRFGPSLQKRVNRAYKFCFVRHPLSWYESYFRFMSAAGWRRFGGLGSNPWHPNAELFELGSDDFNRFVWNVISRHPGYVSRLFSSYTEPNIDFVGKQESLADDLVAVLEKLEVSFDEKRIRRHPKTLVSEAPGTPIEWDQDLRAQVERLEQDARSRYGYLKVKRKRRPRASSAPTRRPRKRRRS